MSLAITAKGLSMTYERPGAEPFTALAATDLTLAPGEFFSLVGPSGCGKSTILNLVAGLLEATTGEIRVGQRNVTRPDPSVGIVFQSPALLRWLTVEQNVLLPSKLRHQLDDRRRDTASRLLELTGLGEFSHRYPRELSGGMQQRAAIVRALVGDPAVLLMDEPFSALDEFTRETLNTELLRLWSESPKTILFITHSINEAVFLSDRIGVMSAAPGRLRSIVDINLPRPRGPILRSQPAFYDYVREVRSLIDLPQERELGV